MRWFGKLFRMQVAKQFPRKASLDVQVRLGLGQGLDKGLGG
jgi:hypothetical protein